MNNTSILLLTLICAASLITILYVVFLYRKICKIKVAHEGIENVSGYIREGAMAFLKREFKVIIPFVLIVAIFLTVLGFIPIFSNVEGIGWEGAIAFVVGAAFSAIAGYVGMLSATKSNARTTDAARTKGMSGALRAAFSGGSILGLAVVGLGLLGLTGLFILFYYVYGALGANQIDALEQASHVVSGYGLGCSMIALFDRVGGGIYTKAADVGADIVGKVEENIPEDDPRNPATIADNVGDNVGDVAGMGSDLCESYVGSIISCVTLGALMVKNAVLSGEPLNPSLIIFPLLIAGIGVLASLSSVIFVRAKEWKDPQKTLDLATYISTALVFIASILFSIFYLKRAAAIGAVSAGLISGILVGKIAELYTSSDYKGVKEVAKESETGDATNVISGFGLGMKSTLLTIVTLALGIVVSYLFLGNYGIGLAAVGMLSVAGITISVDAYGPISDNAGGIAEMTKLDPHVREITDKLDAVGNTTAAVGKGFCIGSATFTSLALFLSFSNAANLFDTQGLTNLNILLPEVIVGLLLGAMLPYFFSSLVIASVGRAANEMVIEVRRQFDEHPGILRGEEKPDYTRCVDISTKASLKEMILPGVIAVLSPILVGFILGERGLGGMLIGALSSAIMLAVFMANAGGAWDNAKKFIEQGHFGGKGSRAHKASITGDTVGDPLKDTAGPTMDILIKLMSIISLIMAPVFTQIPSLWELLINLIG
ncbi:MAG: sodium-translocating pyrophosphatase [Gammaproteobacteria bacterium]|nr:sodium-translocating pyrophosphatase [Gammaproteobacteria bacterium]